MKFLAILLIVLLIGAVCLLFTKITITVTAQIDEVAQYADWTVKAVFGILSIKRRMDLDMLLQKARSDKPAPSAGRMSLKQYAGVGPELRRMARKVTIRSFTWRTSIGLGDAADTAIAYGSLWTVKAGIISLMESAMSMKKKQVEIEPDFQRMMLKTRLKCMMDIRAGNAILEAFRIYRKMKRNSVHSVNEDRRSVHGGASH